MIKVLIVEDSALIRQILKSIFDSDPEIYVVGTATNPLLAREMIKQLYPDVITLDIEMPKMDGLDFLEKIKVLRPMPVVMISSLTQRGSSQAVRAMELGAFDVIGKPVTDLEDSFRAIGQEILSTVKAAAKAKIVQPAKAIRKNVVSSRGSSKIDMIAIGASTGGVVALRELLPLLPKESPPIIIVQHMPAAYTASFAERLNSVCELTIRETDNGIDVEPGTAYVANGGYNLRVGKTTKGYKLLHWDDGKISGHKPSVDAAFISVAEEVSGNILAIMLTGMGKDGANGMLALRRGGARTIGQSEDSCVVYGMPRAAKVLGGVEVELPLSKIAGSIVEHCWPT